MKQLKLVSVFFILVVMATAALAEPPANSGIVTRGSYEWAFVEVDVNSGLLAVLGVDIVQWCTDGAPFDTIYYSDKDLQDGFRLNTSEKGYVQASVWPFTDFDCELFTTMQPLATGMAFSRARDNDYFGLRYCDEKNNMNAFGSKANGTLYSPGGEAKQFSLRITGLFDCDTESFPLFDVKISLTE